MVCEFFMCASENLKNIFILNNDHVIFSHIYHTRLSYPDAISTCSSEEEKRNCNPHWEFLQGCKILNVMHTLHALFFHWYYVSPLSKTSLVLLSKASCCRFNHSCTILSLLSLIFDWFSTLSYLIRRRTSKSLCVTRNSLLPSISHFLAQAILYFKTNKFIYINLSLSLFLIFSLLRHSRITIAGNLIENHSHIKRTLKFDIENGKQPMPSFHVSTSELFCLNERVPSTITWRSECWHMLLKQQIWKLESTLGLLLLLRCLVYFMRECLPWTLVWCLLLLLLSTLRWGSLASIFHMRRELGDPMCLAYFRDFVSDLLFLWLCRQRPCSQKGKSRFIIVAFGR